MRSRFEMFEEMSSGERFFGRSGETWRIWRRICNLQPDHKCILDAFRAQKTPSAAADVV